MVGIVVASNDGVSKLSVRSRAAKVALDEVNRVQ